MVNAAPLVTEATGEAAPARRDSRDRYRRDNRAQAPAPDPDRAPKKDLDDAPLYGRIDPK